MNYDTLTPRDLHPVQEPVRPRARRDAGAAPGRTHCDRARRRVPDAPARPPVPERAGLRTTPVDRPARRLEGRGARLLLGGRRRLPRPAGGRPRLLARPRDRERARRSASRGRRRSIRSRRRASPPASPCSPRCPSRCSRSATRRSHRRTVERLSYAGNALPGLVIALSLVFFAARYASPVYQTIALLVFAYVVRFFPQALSGVESALERVNPRYEEAARGLGRGPLQTLGRVTVPLARSGSSREPRSSSSPP